MPNPEGKPVLYERNGPESYNLKGVGDRPWRPQEAGQAQVTKKIELLDDQQRTLFSLDADLDKNGNFKTRPPRYVDAKTKQSMSLDEVNRGQISVFSWWLFLANLFLNFFFLALWFVCLWLVLRFQWLHALGLAIVLWLIALLGVMPMLLDRTQGAAKGKTAQTPNSEVLSAEC